MSPPLTLELLDLLGDGLYGPRSCARGQDRGEARPGIRNQTDFDREYLTDLRAFDVELNNALAQLGKGPFKGRVLCELIADRDYHIRLFDQFLGHPRAAETAEYAERERMGFGNDPFAGKRRCYRQCQALRQGEHLCARVRQSRAAADDHDWLSCRRE